MKLENGLNWLRIRQMMGFCEHSSKLSGTTESGDVMTAELVSTKLQ
jgi:hypothetical protein